MTTNVQLSLAQIDHFTAKMMEMRELGYHSLQEGEIQGLGAYILEHYQRLVEEASQTERKYIYESASTKPETLIRSLEVHEDGTLYVHFTKTRIGDMLLGRGSARKFRLAYDFMKEEVLAVGTSKIISSEEFLNEATILEALRGKEGIVDTIGSVEVEGKERAHKFFLKQAVYEKTDLIDLIGEGHIFTTKEQLTLAKGLLLGICAIHRAGIIHRDIKPDNVLLTHDGDPVICDFGFACHERDEGSLKNDKGSFPYLSPEYARDILEGRKNVSLRGKPSDIWALGCILYVLYNGWSMPWFVTDSIEQTRITAELTIKRAPKTGAPSRVKAPTKTIEEDPLSHLIIDMLQINYGKRITAEVACSKYLSHICQRLEAIKESS